MESKIKNNCDGRGCRIYIRSFDSRINPVYSQVLPKRYDIKKMVYSTYIFLDKVVEKKR